MANPRRYYLLSYPRTASNLLLKILALDRQPGVSTGDNDGGYFFVPYGETIAQLGLEGRNVDDWTADEVQQVRASAQRCFDAFQRCVQAAEARGHSCLIKEHTVYLAGPPARSRLRFSAVHAGPWTLDYGDGGGGSGTSHSSLNISMLPDEFLLTWLPIFLIRHPALAFPSFYRTIVAVEGEEAAGRNDFASMVISVEWTRSLHTFYEQRRGELAGSSRTDVARWPIVIDAEDLIAHPGLVAQLCDRMGLDRHQLRFNWDATRDDDVLAGGDRGVMRSTLFASTGIIGGKAAPGVDIANEVVKWRVELGDAAAEHIEKLVRGAMPHYLYLRERRLRPATAC